jgi:hypothetical protein
MSLDRLIPVHDPEMRHSITFSTTSSDTNSSQPDNSDQLVTFSLGEPQAQDVLAADLQRGRRMAQAHEFDVDSAQL